MSDSNNLSIKQWALADRPREKLLEKGIASLSDAELIAILLSTGTKNMSAVDLGKLILSEANNNLHLLGKKSVNDLQKINGIGQAKAITIIAAMELGKRRKNADLLRQKVSSSVTVFELFQPLLGDLPHEEFWVIYLSRANNIIAKERISLGGTAGTVIDVKIIMKYALEYLSNGIILVHNHPSGNKNPSSQDKQITQKIKNACEIMDVQLLDHVIIADTKYLSFADEGIL
jgi:DNA repair protein RadC